MNMMILRLLQLYRLPTHLLLACQWGLMRFLGSGLQQLLKLQLLHQFLKLQQGHHHLPWKEWRLLAAAPLLLLIQLTLAAAAAVAAARLRLRLAPAGAVVAAAAVAVARLRLRLTLAAAKAAVVAVAVAVVAPLLSRRSSQAKSWVAPSAGTFRMVAAIAANNLVGNR